MRGSPALKQEPGLTESAAVLRSTAMRREPAENLPHDPIISRGKNRKMKTREQLWPPARTYLPMVAGQLAS